MRFAEAAWSMFHVKHCFTNLLLESITFELSTGLSTGYPQDNVFLFRLWRVEFADFLDELDAEAGSA
jgi:hypothetical protein